MFLPNAPCILLFKETQSSGRRGRDLTAWNMVCLKSWKTYPVENRRSQQEQPRFVCKREVLLKQAYFCLEKLRDLKLEEFDYSCWSSFWSELKVISKKKKKNRNIVETFYGLLGPSGSSFWKAQRWFFQLLLAEPEGHYSAEMSLYVWVKVWLQQGSLFSSPSAVWQNLLSLCVFHCWVSLHIIHCVFYAALCSCDPDEFNRVLSSLVQVSCVCFLHFRPS